MKLKKLLPLLLVFIFVASTAHAGLGVLREGTQVGQTGELDFKRATITPSGNTTVIDLRTMTQDSLTGAEPIVTYVQSDTDYAFLAFSGDTSATSSISTFTTETSNKFGAIKIRITNLQGTLADKWIRVYDDAD